MSPHRTVRALVEQLAGAGGSPRLTWYDDGERIELSGAVLANWVVKTANLLVEEQDAGPGTTVLLDLPAHWRSVTWALAAWTTGASVAVGPDPAADVVVTDVPGRHAGAAEVVAVALPALARRFDGDLPAGAVDAAAAVMTYGDVLGWVPDADPRAPALRATVVAEPGRSASGPDADGAALTHADLMAWARAGTTVPDGARVAVPAGPGRDADLVAVLRTVLGVLDRSGSVVLVGPALASAAAHDRSRLDAVLATERVTVTAPGVDHGAARA